MSSVYNKNNINNSENNNVHKDLRDSYFDKDSEKSNESKNIGKLPEKSLEIIMNVCSKMFANLKKKNIGVIAKNSGASQIEAGKGKLIINFFTDRFLVDIKNGKIFFNDNACKEVDYFTSSVILNYLDTCDGSPIENRWISFRELPGGLFYGVTIPGILAPLVNKYENAGRDFVEKLKRIGGFENKSFKNSAVVYAFKYFPILMILDERDEEFRGNIRALFDSSAPHYLKTDVVKAVLMLMIKRIN